MGEFGTVPEPHAVRIERVLPGPIERVWAFLTESDKRGLWLAAGEMEPRVGGRVELRFFHSTLSHEPTPQRFSRGGGAEGHPQSGHVTAWEPPRLLRYTWGEQSGAASEVTFELSARATEDVLLVVTHRRLVTRGERVMVATGWDTHLRLLSDRLEGRAPRGFWSTFEQVEAEYAKRLPAD
ncbi:SRPBCC family protein [Myxococcus sp. K15C18031901]|uniref:SRPBCC family protein n=1 Tax=Myxococcus dinghuensis TaxID=2906761 RepID=UPI0020A70AB6|nr:SRPBCC family protein [Myxococcus dinghuensis]MCP3104349.1 SRPBCC family protein [Myxococcus dinghuensis]